MPQEDKLGNALFAGFFGNIKCIEILFPYITIHNIHTFQLMFSKYAKSAEINEYINKSFKELVIKRLRDEYGVNEPEYFLSLIRNSGCEIAGSFSMSCYYEEDWGRTDIDIFGICDILSHLDVYHRRADKEIVSYEKLGASFDSIVDEKDPKYLLKYLACNFLYLGNNNHYFDANSKYWVSESNVRQHCGDRFANSIIHNEKRDETFTGFDFLKKNVAKEVASNSKTYHGISHANFLKYSVPDVLISTDDNIGPCGLINTVFVNGLTIGVNTTKEFINKTFDFAFCKISFDGESVNIPHPQEMVEKRTKILGHYSLLCEDKSGASRKISSRMVKYVRRGFEFPKALYMCEQKGVKEGYMRYTNKMRSDKTYIYHDLLHYVMFGSDDDIVMARHKYGNIDTNFNSLKDFVESILEGKVSYKNREQEEKEELALKEEKEKKKIIKKPKKKKITKESKKRRITEEPKKRKNTKEPKNVNKRRK